jgi:hypothetical protein
MMKLEENEVAILYQIVSQAQFQGKDALAIGKLMEKLQKEMEKFGATFG